MEGTGSVQACALVLITYGSQGCPDDENRKALGEAGSGDLDERVGSFMGNIR